MGARHCMDYPLREDEEQLKLADKTENLLAWRNRTVEVVPTKVESKELRRKSGGLPQNDQPQKDWPLTRHARLSLIRRFSEE